MEMKEAISETVEQLKKGNIILFPSDTIWGLSCDATNPEAVDRLIQLKGRDQHKSFIVLVNSDRMINQCIKDTPEVAWDMIDYTSTPLTLVLDDGQYVAKNAINQDGSLGIRKVQTGSIDTLLSKFNNPIISTSANFSGKPSALTFQTIDPELINQVDYTFPLEQKVAKTSQASKIVRIRSNGEVQILRK